MFRATRVVRQATSVTKSLDPQAAREFVLSLSPEGRTAIVNALELTSKRDAEVAFKLADQNQDSFLTRREFSRWYEQRLQRTNYIILLYFLLMRLVQMRHTMLPRQPRRPVPLPAASTFCNLRAARSRSSGSAF